MTQKTPDNIKPKDWIFIGKRNAVVCRIYEDDPNKVEVVYLDGNRAINEDAHFVDGRWTFVHDGPCGGYADYSSRLGEYVRILRAERWWEAK